MPAGADSPRGHRLRESARLCVALIALYALSLTALLTTTSAAYEAANHVAMCQQLDTLADGQDPLPAQAHHHADTCCAAVSMPNLADPPVAEATLLVWPRDPVLVTAWTDATASPQQTPPRSTARPRAPPTVGSIG